MANNFDFHMLVIYVMFKLAMQVASTATTSNLVLILQLRSWGNTISGKMRKSVSSLNIELIKPCIPQTLGRRLVLIFKLDF